MKCPRCGQETNDVVCSCGYRFEEQTEPPSNPPPKRFCANCGAEVTGKFCAKCGAPTVNQSNPAPNPARPAVNRIPPVATASAPAVNSSNNSLAMAGMILSIIGFVLSAAPGLVIVSIIGLVLSIKGRNSEKKKMATAGIVIGVLGILMGFYFLGSSSDADKGSSSSSSSSSVSSRSSSISSSKISSSSASPAAQPLEVKEPTTSYKELSFYIPEGWEYKEINDMPYYYFDDVHFLFIQSVDNPKDAKFSLSQMKNEVVSGFESTGNSKKTRDLDTSKYNMEMSGFAGESKLENGTLLTSSYVLQSTDYVYVFNFAGTTEDDTFDSEKDLILNSIVGSDESVPVSKNIPSEEAPKASQPAISAGSTAGVGSTIEYDGLKITLDSVTKYTDTTAYPLDKPDAGNIYILLNFTVSNDTEEDRNFNLFYEDSYCDDISIDPELMLVNAPGDMVFGEIAAGKKKKGYVGYQVPSNWGTLEFQYQTVSFLSKTDKAIFKVTSSDVR